MGTSSTTVQDAPAQPKTKRSGFKKLVHDLVHRRRRFRQFLGAVLVFWFTLVGAPTPALWAAGCALATLGMLVRFWASGIVMKNEVLATSGPYAYVRHPLYVGNLLICAGFCVASGLWWTWVAAVVFLLLFYPETIRYEDQKLQRYFTDQWDTWAAGTRALLPRIPPYRGPGEPARWSFKRSLMRNGEPLHVLVLGGCLAYLWFARM